MTVTCLFWIIYFMIVLWFSCNFHAFLSFKLHWLCCVTEDPCCVFCSHISDPPPPCLWAALLRKSSSLQPRVLLPQLNVSHLHTLISQYLFLLPSSHFLFCVFSNGYFFFFLYSLNGLCYFWIFFVLVTEKVCHLFLFLCEATFRTRGLQCMWEGLCSFPQGARLLQAGGQGGSNRLLLTHTETLRRQEPAT